MKKMPPMPVTLFIFVWFLDWFVMIVLNAKPKQNDVAIVKIINVDFFILLEFILLVVLSVTLAANVQVLLHAGYFIASGPEPLPN